MSRTSSCAVAVHNDMDGLGQMSGNEIDDEEFDQVLASVDFESSDSQAGHPSIIALIPAYNEAAKIDACISGVLTIPGISKVIVIDDGSTDDTRQNALLAGATVIRLDENVGKGGALMAGLEDASPDYCLFLDADLGQTSEQAVLLLQAVMTGQADMAIARFPKPSRKVGFGKVKGLAAEAIAKVDPTFDCQAPLSGQRALNSKCLESVLPLADGFGVEVAMTVKALQAGLSVVEIQTEMSHTPTGNTVSGFSHRARQYADVKRAVESLNL